MNKLTVLFVLVAVTSAFAEMRLDCEPFCDKLDFSKFGWPFPQDKDRVRYNRCVTNCKDGNEKTTSCCNECNVDCTGERSELAQDGQQCMNKCTGYYVSSVSGGINIVSNGQFVTSLVDCPDFCEKLDFSKRGWPFPEDKERIGYNRCLNTCERNNKQYQDCCSKCSIGECDKPRSTFSADQQTCLNSCTRVQIFGPKPVTGVTTEAPAIEDATEKVEEPPK